MFIQGRSAMSLGSPSPAMSRRIPAEYYVLTGVSFAGEIIGTIDGRPIHDVVVDYSGGRYRFAGVAPRTADGRYDVIALSEGEWIVEPGLLYHQEESR